MEVPIYILLGVALYALGLTVRFIQVGERRRELEGRLAQIEDVDAEVERRRTQVVVTEREAAARIAADEAKAKSRVSKAEAASVARLQNAEAESAAKIAQAEAEGARREATLADRCNGLAEEERQAKARLKKLIAEVERVESKVDEIDVGLYQPHYDLGSSLEYRQKLDEAVSRRAELFRAKQASRHTGEWTIVGKRREVPKIQAQLAKLMLRAFNGESDTAIARVTWKNITQMDERIRRSFETINALCATFNVAICEEYLIVVLAELRLEHELAERKRQEAEEQRLIREQMREEERVAREIERVQRESEAEEQRYERAIEKARSEFERANAEQASVIQAKIALLETQLAEAHAKAERAKSMAQMTKVGHVYVVSNVGSFGEDVYKIGMTRRLEPMDRIKELGDASVPFDFDVHGMAWSEDAPALEAALHAEFDHRRVNLINRRKEFFHLTLSELGEAIQRRGLKIELTLMAEAREFRESLAHRARLGQSTWRLAAPEPEPEPIPGDEG